MKCPRCGTENASKSTYCSNCGEKLGTKTICSSCGKTVQAGSKFCSYCGARIKGRTAVHGKSTGPRGRYTDARKRTGSKGKNHNSGSRVLGYAILAVLLVGIGVFVIWTQTSSNETAAQNTVSHQDTAWNAAVLSVAENFNCPCGKCTDRLDICTCDLPNGAVETKSYIMELLDSGLSELMVIQKVEEQYGHRI